MYCTYMLPTGSLIADRGDNINRSFHDHFPRANTQHSMEGANLGLICQNIGRAIIINNNKIQEVQKSDNISSKGFVVLPFPIHAVLTFSMYLVIPLN